MYQTCAIQAFLVIGKGQLIIDAALFRHLQILLAEIFFV